MSTGLLYSWGLQTCPIGSHSRALPQTLLKRPDEDFSAVLDPLSYPLMSKIEVRLSLWGYAALLRTARFAYAVPVQSIYTYRGLVFKLKGEGEQRATASTRRYAQTQLGVEAHALAMLVYRCLLALLKQSCTGSCRADGNFDPPGYG